MSKYSSGSYLYMEKFMRLAIEFEADSAGFYRSMQRPELDPVVLQSAPELSLSMPDPSEKPDFRELLQVAIAREEKSARIYRMTADMTVGAFRQLLEGLAAFEEEHERKLRGLQQRPSR